MSKLNAKVIATSVLVSIIITLLAILTLTIKTEKEDVADSIFEEN